MKGPKFTPQSGQSLPELMIVVVIAAIVSTFAFAQLGSSRQQLNRQNVAREFKNSLERARADSVKRRATEVNTMARVVINSAISFSRFTDLNQNGIIETSEKHDVNFVNSGARIVGDGLIFPVTIAFDRRGFVVSTDGGGTEITPVFTVCDGCTAETVSAGNSSTISISAAGTTAVTQGAYVLVGASIPDVSPIPASTQIKTGAVVDPSPTPAPDCTEILMLCL